MPPYPALRGTCLDPRYVRGVHVHQRAGPPASRVVTLIDTSAWVEALRKDGTADVRARVAELLTAGQASLCPIVALELWNGAGGENERARVRRLVDELPCHEFTTAIWNRAYELARSCRSKGVTVPATDLLIAAAAQVHRVGLLHVDRHFDLIAQAATDAESVGNGAEIVDD
ncbi:MAG: PIN domain nuclease [Spirochaetaceae bacterium]|nr:MAG: PIN domain nuclease [Spirochaetaceae bacterium]